MTVGRSAAEGSSPEVGRHSQKTTGASQPDLRSIPIHGLGTPEPVDESTRQDLTTVAKSLGVDPDVYVEQQRGNTAFSSFISSYSVEHPDVYVDSGHSDGNEPGQYYLTLTEDPDSLTLKQLSKLPFDVDVLVGAPISRQKLTEIQSTVGRTLAWAKGKASVESRTSPYGLSVSFTYHAAGLSDAEVDSLVGEAEKSGEMLFANGKFPLPVTFTDNPELTDFVPAADVKGGHSVVGGSIGCTTGFTARNTSNDRLGVLSADHCPNGSPLYDSASGVLEFGKGGDPGCPRCAKRDTQFWRTVESAGHTTSKIFRATSSTERTVTSKGDAGDGDAVCHYGLTTGYSCGTVNAPNVCKTAENGTYYCGMAQASGPSLDGNHGDSGGPWFIGDAARGTYSGFYGSSPVQHLFVNVSNIEFALGDVVIRVQ